MYRRKFTQCKVVGLLERVQHIECRQYEVRVAVMQKETCGEIVAVRSAYGNGGSNAYAVRRWQQTRPACAYGLTNHDIRVPSSRCVRVGLARGVRAGRMVYHGRRSNSGGVSGALRRLAARCRITRVAIEKEKSARIWSVGTCPR